MQEAEELKAKGTTYWRDGDFSAAIKEWSRCIDCVATLCQGGAPSEYKDFLKIVYSNRSAAYLKTKQLTLALADSEKCISLDSRWTKGLTRRGDALLSLERHTEAYNAYTDALRYAASDEKKSLEEKSEQAMRAIRKSASEYRSNNATGLSGKTGHWLLDKISFYSQIIMIANFALYLFPFYNSYNFALIKAYLLCAIVLNFIRIYSRYGMIQFNMDYLQRVLPDNSSLNIFLCIILLSQRPYILSLLPLLFVELQEYTSYFINYGRLNIGAIQQQLGPLLAKYGGAMLRGVDPAVLMNELFSTKSIQLLNTNLQQGAAYCEVMQGLYLLLEIVLPSRNFLFVMLWWQYLQMRYMLDKTNHIKSSFSYVDQQILGVLANPICPPIIRTGYQKLKDILIKRVQIPTASNSTSENRGISSLASGLSKCTIM